MEIGSTPPEDAIVRSKFLDLTKHPDYPAGTEALLPAGLDNIAILRAYEKISTEASKLNNRYKTVVSRQPRAYRSPPRHLIVTGVPEIGSYPHLPDVSYL